METDFVSRLLSLLKREQTSMNILFSELGVSDDTKKIHYFVEKCDLDKKTQGIFAIAFDQKSLMVTDPGFLVFVRWLLK